MNAGGGTGFENYVHSNAFETTHCYRRIMHTEIVSFLQTLGIRGRGMKTADLYVLRATAMPAVLLENLFLDHPQDAARLRDRVFRVQYTQAVARGIGVALRLPARDTDQEKERLIAQLQAEVQRLRGEAARFGQSLERIRNEAQTALK